MAGALSRCDSTFDAEFNNGAHALPGAAEDFSYETPEAIFRANLFGPHEPARRVVHIMRQRGRGRIVNCSSVLGLAYLRFPSAYTETKHAMDGLTDKVGISRETRHRGRGNSSGSSMGCGGSDCDNQRMPISAVACPRNTMPPEFTAGSRGCNSWRGGGTAAADIPSAAARLLSAAQNMNAGEIRAKHMR